MVYYEEGEKYDYRHVLEPIDFELEEGAFRFIQTIFLLKMDETEKGKEVIRQLEKEVETIEMCRTFANQLDKPLVIPLRKERIEQIGNKQMLELIIEANKQDKKSECIAEKKEGEEKKGELIPLSKFHWTLYETYKTEDVSMSHEKRSALAKFLMTKVRYYGEEGKNVMANIPYFNKGIVACCRKKDYARRRMEEVLGHFLKLKSFWNASIPVEIEKSLLREFNSLDKGSNSLGKE